MQHYQKAELKAEQDKITKPQELNSSYFYGINQFEYDGKQNYIVFDSAQAYF